MLIPRTWFKVKRISIWVASLSLISFLHLSVLWSGRLTSYIKIYHLFVTRIYHINFSPVSELEFRLWRWNMTFLDTEMKELGRSIHIHKTRSLIRAPHVCLIHLADRRSLHVGRILTHIHTHTHTHTHNVNKILSYLDPELYRNIVILMGALREKCPNTNFLLARIFLQSIRI